MTVIVAVSDGEHVYMGSDSCGSSLYGIVLGTPKVSLLGEGHELIVGASGYQAEADLLQYVSDYDLNVPLPEYDVFRWLCEHFCPLWKGLAREAGLLGRANTGQDRHETHLLVGLYGQIYWIDSFFRPLRVQQDYWAIGSGAQWALGSMYTSADPIRDDSLTRIEVALKAAGRYSPAVRAPYWIARSGYQEVRALAAIAEQCV